MELKKNFQHLKLSVIDGSISYLFENPLYLLISSNDIDLLKITFASTNGKDIRSIKLFGKTL